MILKLHALLLHELQNDYVSANVLATSSKCAEYARLEDYDIPFVIPIGTTRYGRRKRGVWGVIFAIRTPQMTAYLNY